MANPHSLEAGQYLTGMKRIEVPARRRPFSTKRMVRVVGATGNNLKSVTAEIPVGTFTCITGVSGGGKSTFYRRDPLQGGRPAATGTTPPSVTTRPCASASAAWKASTRRFIDIDQSPIGRTPRSNPATSTPSAFTSIRDWFAALPEAKAAWLPGLAASAFQR